MGAPPTPSTRIRLNPNVDAYSLDFDGVSPRQLCHYREVPATHLRPCGRPLGGHRAAYWSRVTRTRPPSHWLRAEGHDLGPASFASMRPSAATQAACC